MKFDVVKYRTPKFKESFGYIYKKINVLKLVKNKTGDKISNVSCLVHLDIPFSNSFYQNLSDIYKLKELLYNEGIADHNGLPNIKPESSNNLILP